jgi:hypothetical protein
MLPGGVLCLGKVLPDLEFGQAESGPGVSDRPDAPSPWAIQVTGGLFQHLLTSIRVFLGWALLSELSLELPQSGDVLGQLVQFLLGDLRRSFGPGLFDCGRLGLQLQGGLLGLTGERHPRAQQDGPGAVMSCFSSREDHIMSLF